MIFESSPPRAAKKIRRNGANGAKFQIPSALAVQHKVCPSNQAALAVRLTNYLIILPRGHGVDQCVDHGEYQEGAQGAEGEQGHVVHAEDQQQPGDHLEGGQDVDARHNQRQEEDHEYLSADGSLDLGLAHAHLLHDLELVLVVIAFRDLLVVDDQRRGKGEHDAQEDAQEQEAAHQAVVTLRYFIAALGIQDFVPAQILVMKLVHQSRSIFLALLAFFTEADRKIVLEITSVRTIGFLLLRVQRLKHGIIGHYQVMDIHHIGF